MLVPRSVLAARKCGDVNSSRYALGGLCLTRDAETNQPFAIATDGGKLVAMAWREPDAAEFPADIDLTHRPGCQFTIPTAALDKVAACKIGVKSRKPILHYVAVQEPVDDKANTAPMIATSIDETARFEPRLQEGWFPRWRDVIPATKNAITFCVDANRLIDVLQAMIAHTGTNKNAPAGVVFSVDPEEAFCRALVISSADGSGNQAVGVLMPYGDGKTQPASEWRPEVAAIAAPEVAAVDPPAEIPAPEVEPIAPPAPAVEPVDNRPIGRRTRRATEPAATPSPPTLAEVLAATAGSDEPEADEPPAPEWLTTARELVAAGSGDYRAHDGASY